MWVGGCEAVVGITAAAAVLGGGGDWCTACICCCCAAAWAAITHWPQEQAGQWASGATAGCPHGAAAVVATCRGWWWAVVVGACIKDV